MDRSKWPDLSDADFEMIENKAMETVRLIFIDDSSIPLKIKLNTEFDELCAYWTAMAEMNVFVTFGGDLRFRHSDFSDPEYKRVWVQRDNYCTQVVGGYLIAFSYLLNYGLVTSMPKLKYDREHHKLFIKRETYRHNRVHIELMHMLKQGPPPDVCWPGEEAPIPDDESFGLYHSNMTSDKAKRVDKPYYVIQASPKPGTPKLAYHHIISYKLLKEYFRIYWSGEHSQVGINNPSVMNRKIYCRCARLLFACQRKLDCVERLRLLCNFNPFRYRQKTPPIELKANIVADDAEMDLKILRQWGLWMAPGNIFVGPEERGPFDPSKRLQEFNPDFDGNLLFGTPQYEEAFKLYKRMKAFVQSDRNQRDLIEGKLIYESLHSFSVWYKLEEYDETKWEKRTATEEELGLLRKRIAKNYRGKEYWAIKTTNKVGSQLSNSSENTSFNVDIFSKCSLKNIFLNTQAEKNGDDLATKAPVENSTESGNFLADEIQTSFSALAGKNKSSKVPAQKKKDQRAKKQASPAEDVLVNGFKKLFL